MSPATAAEHMDELTLGRPCPTCSAAPGEPCTTRSGNLARYTHERRDADLWAAFRYGLARGYQIALRDLISDLNERARLVDS